MRKNLTLIIMVVVLMMLLSGCLVNENGSTDTEAYKFPPLTKEICESKDGSWDLSTGEPQCVMSYSPAGNPCEDSSTCGDEFCVLESEADVQGKCSGVKVYVECQKALDSDGELITVCP